MTSERKDRRSKCPVTFALDQLGDKWSLLVVRDLMFHGKKTYGEFLESGEGIATNVLADRLKRLEAEGSIEKVRDPDNKRRVLYSLTDKGFDLAPLLVEMVLWSAKHDADTGIPKAMFNRIRKDREGFIAALREGITI